MASNSDDVLAIRIVAEAADAIKNLKKTKESAELLKKEFEKLSEAERKAVVEMAKQQQAIRNAQRETLEQEKRVNEYKAQADKLRKEEMAALNAATKAAQAETAKLASETNKLVSEIQRHAAAVEKSREETEKLRKANDETEESFAKSRSKLSILTTDVGGLGDKIKEIAPYWGTIGVTAVQSFARLSAGVVGAGVALGAMAMQIGQMAGQHEAQQRAVTILGDAYEHVRTATNDTVTAQDALRLQQGLVQSGLQVSGEQLGQLAQRAREYALATGTETPQALGEMLDAMRGLESEGLRKFGITLNATGDRQRDFNSAVTAASSAQRDAEAQARKWGTSLTGVADAQQRLAATMGSSQRTMTEEVDRTSRSFTQMTNGIAAAVARALRLSEVFSFMASDVIPTLFDSVGSDQRNQRSIDASIANRRRNERNEEQATTRQSLQAMRANRLLSDEQFEQFDMALGARNASREDFIRVQEFARRASRESAPVAQSMMSEVMRPFVERQREEQQVMQRAEQLRTDITDMTAQTERKARRAATAGSSGGGGSNELRDAIRAYQSAVAEMPDGAVQVLPSDMPQNPGESATQYYNRLAGIQQGFNSAGAASNDVMAAPEETDRGKIEAALAEQRAGVERDRNEFYQRRSRELGKQDDTRAAEREQFGQSALGRLERATGLQRNEDGSLSLDAAQMGLGLMEQSLGVLQSGFSQLWSNIADGSMTAGEAFQAFAAQSLKALGQIAINEGAAMLFKAIPAAFTSPPLAVAYGLGGAGLIALGVGLGAAGSAITPPPKSAASSSPSTTRGLAPRSARESSGGEMGSVTVVMSSLAPAGPSDAQRYRSGIAHAQRYGYGQRDTIPRRVEY